MRSTFAEINPRLRDLPLMDAAKLQAALNLQGQGDPLTPLRRWWTKKYQRSHLSAEYQQYTVFELVSEFFEDYYEDNKSEMYDLDNSFVTLGDPIIDKWEREVRAGIVPDLMEDLPPEEAKKLLLWSKKAYEKKVIRGIVQPSHAAGIGAVKESISDMEELLGDDNSFTEDY